MIVAMTANDAVLLIGGAAAAVGTVVGALLGKGAPDAWEKLSEGHHRRRMERLAAEDRRKAEERAHQEKVNDSAHKKLIAYLDQELETIRREFRESQKEAQDCHARCAGLVARDELREAELQDLRAELRDTRARVAHLEGRKDSTAELDQIKD